jgi:hypothetical protein
VFRVGINDALHFSISHLLLKVHGLPQQLLIKLNVYAFSFAADLVKGLHDAFKQGVLILTDKGRDFRAYFFGVKNW